MVLKMNRVFRSSLAVYPMFVLASAVSAEDWGVYRIVSASAPTLVLESVNAGIEEGTVVSVNKPANSPHQKWLIIPKEEGYYSIVPAHARNLVLAAVDGGTKNGTAIVLEKENRKASQLWSLTKHDDGSYSILPKHAPEQGLDHFAGKPVPGARIDLWTYHANDRHLQWWIRPLAGSGVTSPNAAEMTSVYEPPMIRPEEILRGQTKQFTFLQSRVFPGTVREVTLFVPAQYDGTKPACVYVKTDGFNPRKRVDGDDDCDQRDAGDDWRLRSARRSSRTDERNARTTQPRL